MKKKKVWASLAAASLALVLAACGDEDKSADSSSAAKSETKELTVGIANDVGPINLYTESEDWLNEMVYDKLMASSPYVDEPTPWLAESVKQLDDKTWQVKVRDGIKWQDGEDFTAEDVKFTYEYYRDGPQNRYTHHVNEVPDIESIDIDKENDDTLTFACSYACPQLDTITFADLPILPEHIWKDVENPRKMTDLAVGTGPYKLTEYKEGDHYTLEANDDYFKGEPTVDKINLPIIGDSTAMFNALKSGEIDISKRTVPVELQDSLASNFNLAKASALSIVQLGMNFTKEPFADADFRHALSLAIDKDAIVKTVGSGESGTNGYPHKDSPWTNQDNSQPFDKAAAEKALDKLGYKDTDGDGVREDKDGNKLSFKLIVSSGEPIYVRVSELVKKQLASVGIEANVKSEDPTTFAADSSEKNYDMYVSLIGAHGVADPDQFIMSNRSGYLWAKDIAYPEMDKLQKEWQSKTTAEERKEVSFKMQKLYNEQPTAISLYYPEEVYAYNAQKYDGYVEALGFGIINKYSFLSKDVQKEASTTALNMISK